MKKIILIFGLILTIPQVANAESTTNVKINNNYSSNNESSITNKTDIYIEENGKITTYSSDKPENVEIKTKNGEAEIKVDGNIIEETPATPTNSPEISPSQTKKEEINTKETLIENVFKSVKEKFKFIEKIFSIFD